MYKAIHSIALNTNSINNRVDVKAFIFFLFAMLFFSCQKEDDSFFGDYNCGLISSPENFTSLPIISIKTKNGGIVDSKENYVKASFYLYGGTKFEDLVSNIEIKGRGNTTWNFPKKPYQIRFENEEGLLGMPEDKKWVLLANFNDKSMLRNKIAFELGALSNLQWTSSSEFFELFMNDCYQGTYQLTQKIDVSPNRVNLGQEGYLLEVDTKDRLDANDVYFRSDRYLFNIKEPSVDFDDVDYLFIQDYIKKVEKVLFGDDFVDPINGYRKYLDIESFVDWYLINEIAKNNDASFHTSVYINLKPGGKLKMGPIWDFDIAMGNINYNSNETTEGFWIKKASWIARLFEDPSFIEEVKIRLDHFVANKDYIIGKIEENAFYLNDAQMENYTKWRTLGKYVWPNYVYFDTYEEEVEYLKDWIDKRMNWLNEAINQL